MNTEYEVIIVYDDEYAEVLVFQSNAIMNDSNDIISEAIRLGLLESQYRNCVRWARGISEYEYEYVKTTGQS